MNLNAQCESVWRSLKRAKPRSKRSNRLQSELVTIQVLRMRQEMIDVTPNMLAALKEMASYPNKAAYHFRQASCRLLVELGYVVPVGNRKRPPYRITDAGRRYLETVKESA
jgi:hypothetical protein